MSLEVELGGVSVHAGNVDRSLHSLGGQADVVGPVVAVSLVGGAGWAKCACKSGNGDLVSCSIEKKGDQDKCKVRPSNTTGFELYLIMSPYIYTHRSHEHNYGESQFSAF